MKYDKINQQLFIDNRARFVAQMAPNSVAIFNSNDEVPRSADSFHTFRQNPDLFYLTGIDQEKTTLILFPDCPVESLREVLFVRQTNEHLAIWEGHKYTKEEAREASGIKIIRWSENIGSFLPQAMQLAETCYLNTNEHSRMSTVVPNKDLRFAREMKDNYPLHSFKRSAPIMHGLRAIKSDLEVALIQHACNITGKAFDRVMKFVKPGVHEYEIEAEIMHEYLINRASGPAYPSIIASGANSCVLHYVDNNQQCKDGDILLMDFGANYANYAADLSRSIPVSGQFSQRQKDVYNAVLRVMKYATSLLVPGSYIDQYHKEVGLAMEEELILLGLLDKNEVKNQKPDAPLYKKYFMHGTSHFLGIDVHDVGNKYEAMKAGNVFTVEPGIYIQEEGLGIRIENDVLITNNGPVDLMAHIPREAEEIEEVMQSKAVFS